MNKLDSDDLDAEKLIRSLPRVGSRGLAGLSYGAAWPVQYHIALDSRPGLTVAAASHLPNLVPVMAQPFMNVLRVLTQMQINAPESPHEVKQVTITPDVIKHALPSISDTFMTRLPVILEHEPPTFGRWPTSADRTYIANLNRFRTQGHDVLHRMISTNASLIAMSDIPPPIWLNTLLRCCIDLL